MPWAPDVQVVYEHLHRYLWAAELMEGRRVLDLASGEGFGAAILARSAASVVGLDIDQPTVDHSSLNYGDDRIEFRLGDARDLSDFESGSFGAVVAFEMIEHIEDQERVLDEIGRVLTSDGLLVISTPDRRAYTDATGHSNPFHVRELDQTEFDRLLRSRFENTATWGQRTITGSALSALTPVQTSAPSAARTLFIEHAGEDWAVSSELSPMYLVAVASQVPLPTIPRDSTLADGGAALLRAAEEKASEAIRTMEAAAQAHDREVGELRDCISELEAETGLLEAEIGVRGERMEALEATLQEVLDAYSTLRGRKSVRAAIGVANLRHRVRRSGPESS